MAVVTAPAASLHIVTLFHFLLVILIHPGQSRTLLSAGNAATNPLNYEELATSIVVNQLTILQMMENASNASQSRPRASPECAGIVEVREMSQKLDAFLEEVRKPEKATPPQTEEEEMSVYSASMVHNDTLPSLCNGNKVLVGSIGSLAMVKSGTYDSNLQCSWNITLPVKAPLSLTWDYIDMEEHHSCGYDWVAVEDLSRDAISVYGRKLCGSVNPSEIGVLNVVLPPTKNILVSFRSDGSNEKRGFKLDYRLQAH